MDKWLIFLKKLINLMSKQKQIDIVTILRLEKNKNLFETYLKTAQDHQGAV